LSTLEQAIIVAADGHQGQYDKAGLPYIFHPLRVMMALTTEEEQIVGVLHDVLEDTVITEDRLRYFGFSELIIEAVKSVTRREGESYSVFIRRCKENEIGVKVKIVDLKDNMNISRIPNPSQEDFRRIEKYKKALAILLDEE
jgi:(p)ppGpp synthase/HD superfamily hydrolase